MKSFKNATLAVLSLTTLLSSAAPSMASNVVSNEPFVVSATVKVKAGTEAAFKAAAEEFVLPSRKEMDNIDYTFVQSPSDPTEFATIEHWKSQAGINAHMSSPHMQVFFGKVGPLFEQGYPQIRQYIELAK